MHPKKFKMRKAPEGSHRNCEMRDGQRLEMCNGCHVHLEACRKEDTHTQTCINMSV